MNELDHFRMKFKRFWQNTSPPSCNAPADSKQVSMLSALSLRLG